jgi:hypothetical protein
MGRINLWKISDQQEFTSKQTNPEAYKQIRTSPLLEAGCVKKTSAALDFLTDDPRPHLGTAVAKCINSAISAAGVGLGSPLGEL